MPISSAAVGLSSIPVASFSRPAKTLKSNDGIFCYKLAIMLESIGIVQGIRQTRLPLRHLTFKVKLQGQKIK